MLDGLATFASADQLTIPDLNMDASWFDFKEAFEGVGEFIGGIFDGL